MTLADKIVSLNKALAIIDNLLIDAENQADVKVYSELYATVNETYIALTQEWLEQ